MPPPASGSNDVGSPCATCPKKESSLLVAAVRGDTGAALGSIQVAVKGPSPGQKATSGGTGTALFDPAQPGRYTVEATLSGALAEELDPAAPVKVTVLAGSAAVATLVFQPRPELIVEVVFIDRSGAAPLSKPITGATVKVEQPGTTRALPTGADGCADFAQVKTGVHQILVTLKPDDLKKYRPPARTRTTLAAGERGRVIVEVEDVASCWLEVELVDPAGALLPDETPYWARLADGQVREGKITGGLLRLDRIACGPVTFRLPGVSEEDFALAHEDVPPPPPAPHWIEVVVRDGEAPAADLVYVATLADGTKREGRLDASGVARLEGIPAGSCEFSFPEIEADDLTFGTPEPDADPASDPAAAPAETPASPAPA